MSFIVTSTQTQTQLNYKTDKDAQKMHNVYLYLKYLHFDIMALECRLFKIISTYSCFTIKNE